MREFFIFTFSISKMNVVSECLTHWNLLIILIEYFWFIILYVRAKTINQSFARRFPVLPLLVATYFAPPSTKPLLCLTFHYLHIYLFRRPSTHGEKCDKKLAKINKSSFEKLFFFFRLKGLHKLSQKMIQTYLSCSRCTTSPNPHTNSLQNCICILKKTLLM